MAKVIFYSFSIVSIIFLFGCQDISQAARDSGYFKTMQACAAVSNMRIAQDPYNRSDDYGCGITCYDNQGNVSICERVL